MSSICRGQAASGGPARLYRFELVSVRYSAADDLDNLAQLDAHGHFHKARVSDLPGQRENFVPLLRSEPMLANHRPPLLNDRRDVGEGFTVGSDQCRPAPQPAHRGIGRTRSAVCRAAFDGGDQRRFFCSQTNAPAPRRISTSKLKGVFPMSLPSRPRLRASRRLAVRRLNR